VSVELRSRVLRPRAQQLYTLFRCPVISCSGKHRQNRCLHVPYSIPLLEHKEAKMSAYHFVDSDHCRPPGSVPIEYELKIRQEPRRAKVCSNKEKERRPIDPPPIIQLKIKDDRQDPCHNYLQSPHLFVCVDLFAANESTSVQANVNNALAGTSVSSLYRLKDIDNSDGGFFVFGDLSVRIEGQFRLRFYLFEVQKADVCFLQSITSDVFQVYSAKQFPGMLDSTFLSRSFSDQGVRIRIRKEHRIKMFSLFWIF
jgi:hypothetical protein